MNPTHDAAVSALADHLQASAPGAAAVNWQGIAAFLVKLITILAPLLGGNTPAPPAP